MTEEPRYHGKRIAAVIPAYNERLVIGSVIPQAQQHVDQVIVVDDGSTDRTAAIALLAGADIIRMPENGGKAKVMMVGFARARALGYEAVVMLDDDFATTDPQCSFRALSRRALEYLTFSPEGYSSIESDMIAHFAPLGLKMSEVPISVTYDVPHKHKKNPVSYDVGVLAWIVELIGYQRPLLFFGIPVFLFTFLGLGAEIFAFSQYYHTAQFHYIIFTGGFVALILGLLLVTPGLILNSLMMIMMSSAATGRGSP